MLNVNGAVTVHTQLQIQYEHCKIVTVYLQEKYKYYKAIN